MKLATCRNLRLRGRRSQGAGAHARSQVKIGVLNDRSGLYADVAGEGSVVAAQMAVEEFGGRRQASGRDRLGRSPEQGRYRRQHRAPVVSTRTASM